MSDTRDAVRAAAAWANDRLVEAAPKCPECGMLAERGHYLGCSALPAPVPIERCDECNRTTPHHALTCLQGPLAGLRPARTRWHWPVVSKCEDARCTRRHATMAELEEFDIEARSRGIDTGLVER